MTEIGRIEREIWVWFLKKEYKGRYRLIRFMWRSIERNNIGFFRE